MEAENDKKYIDNWAKSAVRDKLISQVTSLGFDEPITKQLTKQKMVEWLIANGHQRVYGRAQPQSGLIHKPNKHSPLKNNIEIIKKNIVPPVQPIQFSRYGTNHIQYKDCVFFHNEKINSGKPDLRFILKKDKNGTITNSDTVTPEDLDTLHSLGTMITFNNIKIQSNLADLDLDPDMSNIDGDDTGEDEDE